MKLYGECMNEEYDRTFAMIDLIMNILIVAMSSGFGLVYIYPHERKTSLFQNPGFKNK